MKVVSTANAPAAIPRTGKVDANVVSRRMRAQASSSLREITPSSGSIRRKKRICSKLDVI